MKINKRILSLVALTAIAIATMPDVAQSANPGKSQPVENLLGLLDSSAYNMVSYTRVPLKLPPPEAQNKNLDLGTFDLYGLDLLSIVEMPPSMYQQFTGRLVSDCISATGTINDKCCHTAIAMFDRPLPELTKLIASAAEDINLSRVTSDKAVLTWHRGSSDWYLTILGKRLLVVSTDLKVITDATNNYNNNKINQIDLLNQYKDLLTASAPHAQVDGSKENCPPLVLQMDNKRILTLSMPNSAKVKPTRQDWDKVLHAFEQDTDVKLSESAPFTITIAGDSSAQLKVQKCLMVECSPAIVHHFKVSR